jgi:hypothetical protein|tara:strand:- start:1681 stop:1953 length:273 start_codon:yes stop_codon:yes gene_type:complete
MKLVRLSSGEEVIGNVIERDDEIEISDGYMLMSPEPGKIGFMPFMAYCKSDSYVVNKRFVMFLADPVDDLVQQIRTMKSGLVTPTKGIVT